MDLCWICACFVAFIIIIHFIAIFKKAQWQQQMEEEKYLHYKAQCISLENYNY